MTTNALNAIKNLSNDRSRRFNVRAISLAKDCCPEGDSKRLSDAIALIRTHDGKPGGATRNSVIVTLRELAR